ncbi:MAG TPA: sigma factor [Kofleriaceae bacterium]|nr:sigma factor [Kofleriaceae bacterium]
MQAKDKEAAEQEIGELLERGDLEGAATKVMRSYGPQILAYLRAVLRDKDAAAEGFSQFGEGVWKGIGKLRGQSSVLTWSYGVAWGAVRRLRRDPFRRKARRLDTSQLSQLAAEVRTSTSPYRKTNVKDAVARLRESLAADEQTLLILRVDRNLSWKDVVQVFTTEGEPVDEAALRKRFERIKTKLRKLATEEGFLGPRS